jgi:hypothetical protein
MAGESKSLTFSEGAEVAGPANSAITAANLSTHVDDAAFVTAKGSAATLSDLYTNSTLNVIRHFNGTSWISVVDEETVQTLVNKKLQDSSTSFVDDVDATKVAKFQLSGITTATTRTLTIPDADITISGRDNTETVTNKTMTSPVINTPNIDGGTASNASRFILPKETTVNLDALTDVEGLGAFDTTLGLPVYNDGTGWSSFGRLIHGFRYDTYGGYGSTNNKIIYMSSLTTEIGSGLMTDANSSTNGLSFTAIKDCIVHAHITFHAGGGTIPVGFSLNSNQLTTSFGSINNAHQTAITYRISGMNSVTATCAIPMAANDVLRPHSDGTAPSPTSINISLTAIG